MFKQPLVYFILSFFYCGFCEHNIYIIIRDRAQFINLETEIMMQTQKLLQAKEVAMHLLSVNP